MKKYIDLHMHTDFSDGSKSPSELLAIVRSKKISAFAVTDHDTFEGYFALKELLQEGDPELIPGVELSVSLDDGDMHILAYLFDPQSKVLQEAMRTFQENRIGRGKKMVEKLNEMGIKITYKEVVAAANGSVVGRPHIAQVIFESNQIDYYEEAFHKYIGDKAPAFVAKENFTVKEAIDLIQSAGGVAVLAHPGINNKEEHLDMLVDCGLDGIEAYHSSHKQSDRDRYLHLAERHRLIVTGGSDYHGRDGRHGSVGSERVPYRLLEELKEKAKKNRG